MPSGIGFQRPVILIQINKGHRHNGLVEGATMRGAMTPATYSIREHLRDGRAILVRALRPDDQADMLAAIDRTSIQSLQRRFFVAKRGFSEQEQDFFMQIDFVNHVALVTEIEENGHRAIVGGGRYVVVQPGQAELAFVVIDAYQGQGIGTMLMRHLLVIARKAGLNELTADVLSENVAMLGVFKRFGFASKSQDDPQMRHLALRLRHMAS
jgi:RimJ/RimL family protein N-acetyltransferase